MSCWVRRNFINSIKHRFWQVLNNLGLLVKSAYVTASFYGCCSLRPLRSAPIAFEAYCQDKWAADLCGIQFGDSRLFNGKSVLQTGGVFKSYHAPRPVPCVPLQPNRLLLQHYKGGPTRRSTRLLAVCLHNGGTSSLLTSGQQKLSKKLNTRSKFHFQRWGFQYLFFFFFKCSLTHTRNQTWSKQHLRQNKSDGYLFVSNRQWTLTHDLRQRDEVMALPSGRPLFY